MNTARTKCCMRCWLHLSSIQTKARAELLQDARGVARAMLIDAMSFQNEAQGHTCKCDQNLG